MADITTTIISGAFTIAGSLGSIWLKDYLEKKRQGVASPSALPNASPTALPPPPPQASRTRPASRYRPLYIAVAGFALGAVSSLARPHFRGPSHPEAIISLALLVLAVLTAIMYHARTAPSRGLALFELEVFSLWAAYATGWSIVHGSLWSDFISFVIVGWLGSAITGPLLILALRRFYARSA